MSGPSNDGGSLLDAIFGVAGKHVGDGLSVSVLLGTLANILPSIAALMTIIWTAIRIWETDTCKRLFRRKD